MTPLPPARSRRARRSAPTRPGVDVLVELSRALSTTTTVAAAAQAVVEATRRALGSATCALAIAQSGELEPIAFVGYGANGGPGVEEAIRQPLAHRTSPLAMVTTSGVLEAWPTTEALEAALPDFAAELYRLVGVQSAAATPLMVEGHPIGALQVGFADERVLTDAERILLEAIGHVAAQAVARSRLVEAERQGRRMLIASLEQMPLGVLIVDRRGEIAHINEAGLRIWLGSRWPGPIPENPPRKGYHADGRPYAPEEWPRYRSATSGEVVVDEEITIETADGEHIVISANSAPVDDPEGRRIGAVVVFSDVTDRARAAAIREAYTGVLSHELRTPVTSIYGAAGLLSRRGQAMSPENRAVLIEDLEGAAEHLLRLVENLLILSRVEHQGVQVEVSPLLLQHVAADLVRQEARTWPRCTIEVVTPLGSPLPVLGDLDMVTLMLRNLIGNAAKYAPGRIQVALEPDGDHVRVAVRDSGPGISPSELVSVFHLFNRSPATAKRAPGSGIGLYIVRHVAEAQGGRAWALNLPGGGAEVGFSLPVAADTDAGE